MIISRWNGFEIDSSEGYYSFEKDIKNAEEAWNFLINLLFCPLIWPKISFNLIPIEIYKQDVETYLSEKLKLGAIEKFEHEQPEEVEEEKKEYDYHDEIDGHLPSHIYPDFKTSLSSFFDIINNLKNVVRMLSVNFCLAPFKDLPEDEYQKLQAWFLRQFKDKGEGKTRWQYYFRVEEKDFKLLGNTEDTSSFSPPDSFEGSFEFFLKGSIFSYRLNIPAVDPSLMIYLLLMLLEDFDLKFRGTHYTFDHTPDKIQLLREPDMYDYPADKLKLLK